MLRVRTDLWCLTLMGSLGLLACGGKVPPNPGSNAGAGGAEPEPSGYGGSTNPQPTIRCKMDVPVMLGNTYTGLAQCEDGVVHRPEAVQCENRLPRAAEEHSLPEGGECVTDSDCTAGPLGYCEVFGQIFAGQCRYGCATDSDCGAGAFCECGPDYGHCVAATCTSDTECGSDLRCSKWTPRVGHGCGEEPHFACEVPGDQCHTDADCGPLEAAKYCSAESGTRVCKAIPPAACGRPFLVQGQERLAAPCCSDEWRSHPAASMCLEGLTESQRQYLGQAWTSLGLMEHASIAAFARYTLQLLHLGAPRSLLQASQQAMLDETQHAELCFEVASQLLGHGVGAAALPIDGALEGTDLARVVCLTIREGCVGETVAALEAAEALAHAQVPHIRSVLEQIVVDEQAHAELAWRFVAWALETGGTELRQTVSEEFASAVKASAAPAPTAAAFDTRAYGVLLPEQRAEIRARVLRDIVGPCAERLLDSSAPSTQRARPLAVSA